MNSFFQNFPNLIKINTENLFENCIFLEYLEIPKINNFKINLNNCKNLLTLKIQMNFITKKCLRIVMN